MQTLCYIYSNMGELFNITMVETCLLFRILAGYVSPHSETFFSTVHYDTVMILYLYNIFIFYYIYLTLDD